MTQTQIMGALPWVGLILSHRKANAPRTMPCYADNCL